MIGINEKLERNTGLADKLSKLSEHVTTFFYWLFLEPKCTKLLLEYSTN